MFTQQLQELLRRNIGSAKCIFLHRNTWTQRKHSHTFMPRFWFEARIAVFGRQIRVHAFDCAATANGSAHCPLLQVQSPSKLTCVTMWTVSHIMTSYQLSITHIHQDFFHRQNIFNKTHIVSFSGDKPLMLINKWTKYTSIKHAKGKLPKIYKTYRFQTS
jgi:hypothetical protein